MLNVLRLGSVGSKVQFLQIRLNATAAVTARKLKVDGAFGSSTNAAVQDFQARHGLVADGIVGPKTWSALAIDAARRVAPQNVQKFVKELGTVDDFVNHVQWLEVTAAKSKLDVMRKVREFSGTRDGRRYLIVRKGGTAIIDFRHFFAAASETCVKSNPTPLGGSRGDTLLLGVGNEVFQCIDEMTKRRLNSCFSAEDLGSNRLGAEFGRLVTVRTAENSPVSISQLLAGYLRTLDPQPTQSVHRVKLPGNSRTALEAVTAVLIGIFDLAVPDAY